MRAPVRGKKSDNVGNNNNNNKPASTAFAQDNGVTSVKAPLLATQQQQQYNTSGLATEEEYQRQRLQDIDEIEGQTAEVHALYKDFNLMVDTQQQGLNIVEKNVEKSTDHVVKGTGELKKASEAQKCSRKCMCGVIVLIVVIVVIVVVVMYSQNKL